jgi:hypothetical protein
MALFKRGLQAALFLCKAESWKKVSEKFHGLADNQAVIF